MKTHPSLQPRRPFLVSRVIAIVTILLAALLVPTTQITAASPPGFETGGADSGPSNEMIVLRLFDDVFGGENADACPELVANEAMIHTPDGLYLGHEGMSSFANRLRVSFPDANFHLTDLEDDGDMVVARWVMTGTHNGAFEGLAASGMSVSMEGIAILRFERGKIIEQWVAYDRLHLVQQINGVSEGQNAPTRDCQSCETSY